MTTASTTITIQSLKQSPLHERHLAAGARFMEFAGWEMPVQYQGIREEHLAVRKAVGVFDISHMGQLFVSGPEAMQQLDRLLTNRLSALAEGEGQYTFLLNERGGVIDDLIVYRIKGEFLLIVNASKISEDEAWITTKMDPSALLRNESQGFGGLAIQGPQSFTIFTTVFGSKPPTRNQILSLPYGGRSIFVAGTGYTGEEGFEVFFPIPLANTLWDAFLAAGAQPCGLGARNTLRLEMCYPLNGADLSPDRTPLEAGLGFFVDLMKEDFMGKTVLIKQKETGLKFKLSAIEMPEKGFPLMREHYPVLKDGTKIAELTSGAFSPSLGYSIAMAYLPLEYSQPETELTIEVRNKPYPAKVCRKPFYKKS